MIYFKGREDISLKLYSSPRMDKKIIQKRKKDIYKDFLLDIKNLNARRYFIIK